MALTTAAKAGVAGTVAVGGSGLTATYLAWDRITLYEVERKIIEGEASLTVESESSGGNVTHFIIKTSDKDPEWKKDGGYYWECKVAKPSFDLDETDLEVRLKSIFGGDTKNIRKHLVGVCSSNRGTEKSDKNITTTFAFPQTAKADNWSEYLFGEKDSLNEVEKAVLDDKVYFTVSKETSPSLTFTATASTDTAWEYKWKCKIIPSDGTALNTQLEDNLPKAAGESAVNKKENKKKLVYACSKGKTKDSTKEVEAEFKDKAETINGIFTTAS